MRSLCSISNTQGRNCTRVLFYYNRAKKDNNILIYHVFSNKMQIERQEKLPQLKYPTIVEIP